MKISIVVPAYNEEELLPQCLATIIRAVTVANLTPEECEIIVVNNASTDRTKEIALSFRGVKVIDEPHKGLTWAKQAGFLAAKGELVAHPDADTLMPEGWLIMGLSQFERHPELAALSGPYIYYDLPWHARAMTNFYYCLAFMTHLFIRDVLHIGSMMQGGNYVVKHSALESVGGYDTSIKFYGEDFDIGRRVSKFGKVKWTWKFYMYSSGRRLAKEGIVMTGIRYGINNLSATFFKRPIAQEYTDIRAGVLPENKEEK